MCCQMCFTKRLYTLYVSVIFFFNDTATTEIYTLSLHDALPISQAATVPTRWLLPRPDKEHHSARSRPLAERLDNSIQKRRDRKSTRLNSSHANISYAVFCLKKKKNNYTQSSQLLKLFTSRLQLS